MRVISNSDELAACIKQYDKFYVYGTGVVVRTVVRYLISPEVGLIPENIIRSNGKPPKGVRELKNAKISRTAKEIKGIKVIKLNKFKRRKDSYLMVVAARTESLESIELKMQEIGVSDYVAIDEQLYLEWSWAENVPMSFLSPGFAKCATSALNTALKKNKKIFLSKQKETNYMHWRCVYDDSPERFKRMYYPKWKEGQILGNFEPSYHIKSKQIYECFGPNLKLIFMMRNPASATYSFYKMMARRSKFKSFIKYYFKYRHFCPKMFDAYLKDFIYTGFEARFQYDYYISKFLEFWPKENMKFIFFEDLIKDPERIMTEVQEFIGVEPVAISKLPSANVGTAVSKNFISAVLNWFCYRLELKVKSIPSKKTKKKFLNFRTWLYKHTMVENNDKLDEDLKATLTEFYMDSIKRLEKITGRDLNGVWY